MTNSRTVKDEPWFATVGSTERLPAEMPALLIFRRYMRSLCKMLNLTFCHLTFFFFDKSLSTFCNLAFHNQAFHTPLEYYILLDSSDQKNFSENHFISSNLKVIFITCYIKNLGKQKKTEKKCLQKCLNIFSCQLLTF